MWFFPIVGRHDGVAGPIEEEVGAAFRGIAEASIAGQGVGSPEPVQRPRLSARPRRIGAPTLVGAVAEELARLEVEDRLVSCAPVTAHEVTSRRQAVLGGDPQEVLVAGCPSG